MTPTVSPLRRSLGGRLFLLSGGLVLAAMTAAVGLTAWRASQVADQWVRETLAASSATQGRVEHRRLTQLRLMTRFAAADPSFAAYVADADPTSVRDLLLERQREVECDLMIALDSQGRVRARTDRPGATGEDLSAEPLVAAAREHGESAGLLRDGNRYWTAAVVPIVAGQESLLGFLIAGLAVDDELALDVGRGSGADVAYVAHAPEPRVVASTLGDDPALLRAVGLLASAKAGAAHPSRFSAGGRTWAFQVSPLTGGESAGEIVAVTMASLDRVLTPFRRIERVLVGVGVVSLIGAFAISWLLSRRVTRPLEQLADAAEAAREGRYDAPLAHGGEDEVGRLARAFRGLLGELREEREMESYLGALSRSLPDAEPAGIADGDPLKPGTTLAERYEIVARLGAGGYGVVYKARDRQLQDIVALKVLRAGVTEPEALAALKEELRIARRITHRNVLRTHDFGEADGMPFISMEFVRGMTLRELLEHTARLPTSVALRLARQLLSGVEAAHRMGVVHRDLKPENLILDSSGLLRVMDFGIARATRIRKAPGDRNVVVGTLGYLAPEQLDGTPGDVRSDLYACGAVLYEVFSGRRPFLALDPNELWYRMQNEDPTPLAQVAPDVPAEVCGIVMRSLERDPARRFASASEMLEALSKVET